MMWIAEKVACGLGMRIPLSFRQVCRIDSWAATLILNELAGVVRGGNPFTGWNRTCKYYPTQWVDACYGGVTGNHSQVATNLYLVDEVSVQHEWRRRYFLEIVVYPEKSTA